MSPNTDAHPIEVGLALLWITAEVVLALAVALAALVLAAAGWSPPPGRRSRTPQGPPRRAQEPPASPQACDPLPEPDEGLTGPPEAIPAGAAQLAGMKVAQEGPQALTSPAGAVLTVQQLRTLARERLGSAARVGGRRIAQARRAELVDELHRRSVIAEVA